MATCLKAPSKFVLSRSDGGAHVMPVCQTAMTKCLPPTVVQAHVLKILVFLLHFLLSCSGVRFLANQSLVVSFCKASPFEDELPRILDFS